jgi:hypothetical protein
MMAMETRKRSEGNAVVFYGFDVFMFFSFIWDEFVAMDVAGCWLIVWQGSWQVKIGGNLAVERKKR